jgi:hypothetical protein
MKSAIRAIAIVVTLTLSTVVFAQRSGTISTSAPARGGVAPTAAAVPPAADESDALQRVFKELFSPSTTPGVGAVWVVPTGEMNGETLAAAHEDVNVMSRILAGSLRQTGTSLSTSSAFGDLSLVSALNGQIASGIEGLYLQGYGVLFTMKVGFPLAPGPDSNEPKEEPAKTGEDPVWQKAKSDLYEPPAPRAGTSAPGQEKYSAERVENLKTTVIAALKHAANIRGLQPTDSVVVTIVGRPPRTIIASIDRGPDGWVVVDNTGKRSLYTNMPKDLGEFTPAIVLTIRAKMSDVAAFAKGTVTLDQFRQKVQVLSMPYLGNATGLREGRGGRGGFGGSSGGGFGTSPR